MGYFSTLKSKVFLILILVSVTSLQALSVEQSREDRSERRDLRITERESVREARQLVKQTTFAIAQTAVLESDSLALIDLYNATDGVNWEYPWDLTTPVADWDGIYLNVDGSVNEIALYDNNLIGTIPTTLGNLASLEYLYLEENQLTGSIPVELGSLSLLYEVSLYYNQLSGAIPVELGNLSNLEYLYLNENQLTGSIPIELGNLINLSDFELFDNQLTGSIPPELGNLEYIADLDLSYNQLTGTIPTTLGNLFLDGDLDLSHNQLTGSIPVELANITDLYTLVLSYNQLTGTIPTELGNYTGLYGLYLDNNQLTGSIPTSLGNMTTAFKRLYLNNNQLSGSIPTELGSASNLLRIYLDHNQLTGSIPTSLGNLTSLQYLRLENNQLSGSIPTELGNSNLYGLYLYNNQLTGSLPTELGALTNLRELNVGGNQLTGTIPASFAGMTNLATLNIAINSMFCADTVPAFDFTVNGASWQYCAGPVNPAVASWSSSNTWATGIDGGAMGEGVYFPYEYFSGEGVFGSTLVESYPTNIELRLDASESSNAQTYREDDWFHVGGVGTFPGSAWDMSNPAYPRRLNICFVESDDGSGQNPANLQWDPNDASDGKMEYVFIMNSSYLEDPSQLYDDSNEGPEADVLYSWHPKVIDGHTSLESSATLSIQYSASIPPLVMLSGPGAPDDFGPVIDTLDTFTPRFDWFGLGPVPNYLLYISIDTTFQDAQVYDAGPDMFFQMTDSLFNHTTYYWTVVSIDSSGGRGNNIGGYGGFRIEWGSAPSIVELTTPADSAVVLTLTPEMAWTVATDPDPGDVVSYKLYWMSAAGILDSVLSSTNTVVIPTALEDNSQYSWGVIAMDSYGGMSASSWATFWTDTQAEAPSDFALLTPVNDVTGLTSSLSFTWEQSIDPDPLDVVEYTLQIADDALFTAILYEASTGTEANHTMSQDLGGDTEYWWRVIATDTDALETTSPVFKFTVGYVAIVEGLALPSEYVLQQNFPNPFNPSTTMRFGLPEAGLVSLVIYDLSGNTIRVIESGSQPAGWHEFMWNGMNDSGEQVSTGVYLTKLQVGSYTNVIKMLYLK